MVQLSVYRPPTQVEDDVPEVLSYDRVALRMRGRRFADVVSRARIERANTQCPSCQRVTVQPIELGDAVVNRNGATVPGTATVVGFHCNACRHEWPALERA